MHKQSLLLLGFLSCGITLFGQTNDQAEEAKRLGTQAVQIMDEGKYDESIVLLEKCATLDPTNYVFPYEIAYAQFLKKDGPQSIRTLEKLLATYQPVNDRCYQLLGSVYDTEKNPDKALDIYLEGLKKFPQSGRLYLELGVVWASSKNNVDKALEYWEEGIRQDPRYASNYYWAAKTYCQSEEELYGVLYGEIFMNLERNSKRTEEMSELLYQTYRKAITIQSKNKLSISFSKVSSILTVPDNGALKLPFGLQYELCMSLSVPVALGKFKKNTELNLSHLANIRQTFLSEWFSRKLNGQYPNALFDWQLKLQAEGYLEAYSHWLLMKGNGQEFQDWSARHDHQFEAFATWFNEHHIPLGPDNHYYRTQYDEK
jgi:tetratricopeptide (TPR) repeat protein